MSLPLNDRDLANAKYPNLFGGAAYLNATGQFALQGIYSNGSSLFLSGDLLDQAANSFEGLFNGMGTTFNVASGQVQGEFDAYFIDAGAGGISTSGQVVATTGLQVLGGASSFDGGLVITDGSGGLTAVHLGGEILFCTVGGNAIGALLGGITVGPDSSGGVLSYDAFQLFIVNGFDTLFSGVAAIDVASLQVQGTTSLDAGAITTDGAGTLIVTAGLIVGSYLLADPNYIYSPTGGIQVCDNAGLLIEGSSYVTGGQSFINGTGAMFTKNGRILSDATGNLYCNVSTAGSLLAVAGTGTASGKLVAATSAQVKALAFTSDTSHFVDGSGAYQTIVVSAVDTGWTANSNVGDKTVVVPTYANGVNGTMVTALNTISSGTGTAISAGFDQVVLLTKKLQAIETVLAAGKIPNA